MTRKDRLIQVKINTKIKNKLLASFSPGSNLQKFVDMSVARHSDKYAPSDTTALRKSAYANTDFGSGQIIYTIYGNPTGRNTWNDDTSLFQDRPIRGSRWVERWWNNGGKEVLGREIMRFI
jgi:hypothetical protein